MMNRSRIKVEEKELDFAFEVVNIQFNQLGHYMLLLTVENPLLDDPGAGVQVRVNDGDILITNSERTDTIEQTSLDEVCTCVHNRFVFTLPKGFCKNDKNHDVRLKVEAVRLEDTERSDGTKAGEGFFAIYPRTNAPRINLYVDHGEEMYQYSGIMALLRVQNDYLSMHCGRLVYTVAFREARPFVKDEGSFSYLSTISGGNLPGRELSLELSMLPVPSVTHMSSQDESHELVIQDPSTQRASRPWLEPPKIVTQQLEQKLLKTALSPDTKTDLEICLQESHPSAQSKAASSPLLHFPTLAPVLAQPPELNPSQAPEPFPYEQVTESPRSGVVAVDNLLVSIPGKEVVTITLHGASNLPPLNDGGVPQVFVIVKSGADEACGRNGQEVTRCTPQPTHCPWWEERLSIELQEPLAQGQVVVLNVADVQSKQLLAHYRLPVGHLQPFQHYHLELLQAHGSTLSNAHLYVSVVRKVSTLPREPHFSFTGFEVFLQSMEKPLKEPLGLLLAVGRIVPDYHSYRDAMLLRSPRAAGIIRTRVDFPHPFESAFHPPHPTAQGQPQMSLAGSPEEQPVWNHSFLFLQRDCATMFTGASTLVLEYYSATTVMSAVNRHVRGPLSFSAVALHPQLYGKLMSEAGQRGVRVTHLPLRGGTLQTTTDTTPTVSMVVRLIGSERPDSLLSSVEPVLLPCLDFETMEDFNGAPVVEPPRPPLTHREKGTSVPAVHLNPESLNVPQPSLRQDTYDLPSYDALAQILPDYQHLFTTSLPKPYNTALQGQGGPAGEGGTSQNLQTGCPSNMNQTYQVHSPDQRKRLPEFEDDPRIANLQTKEVDNYRTAMSKMAEDIIALRTQIVTLESDNSLLRSDLSLHQDLGRDLLDDTDIDVMTKAEIADRIASLKFKLASETSKAASQRDKIQQMQNDLIRKNDIEKEFLALQKAHQQREVVQRSHHSMATKTTALEATIKQQEKVIEKMEKALDKNLTERNKENAEKKLQEKKLTGGPDSRKVEIESALAAENCRLRGELEKMRQQPAPIIIQQASQARDPFLDKERLCLLSKLEKAEARIRTLESELKDNSRRWGREKQEMLTRLSEHDHGFARTSTTIVHDNPLKEVSDSLRDRSQRRQGRLRKEH